MTGFLTTAAGFSARRFCHHLLAGAQASCALALLLAAPCTRAGESSELAPLAAHGLLLDVIDTGSKLVAVGAHGNVVISRDHGLTWTQSLTPIRALLTGVAFPDEQHGWAVGHDGVIIATKDGGKTWQRQDDGKQLDTVWLDVLFLDATHGFAVGAYGKFLATVDGGKTWTASKPSNDEVHYNRITAANDGTLYLAGEAGTLLVSRDGARTWNKAEVPYDGSLFGALPLDNGRLMAYGLRGHILRSDDHGEHWVPENSDIKILIMGGTRQKDGVIVLGGQGGNFFISRDAGLTFQHWKAPSLASSVADLVATADGWLVTVGETGAARIKLP